MYDEEAVPDFFCLIACSFLSSCIIPNYNPEPISTSNRWQSGQEDEGDIQTGVPSSSLEIDGGVDAGGIPIGASSNSLEIDGSVSDISKAELSLENDNFVAKLISYGFTEEEAYANAEILRKCGIPTIDICDKTDPKASIDGLVVFRGKLDKDRVFWFTVDNRKIFYVSLNGEDLYDEDLGGYLKNFNEVHIPNSYVSLSVYETLIFQSEMQLDKYFVGDGRYYDAWAVGREDDNYMTYCQVSDGSIFTDNWYVAYVWYEQQPNGDFLVTGVQIAGKQYEVK